MEKTKFSIQVNIWGQKQPHDSSYVKENNYISQGSSDLFLTKCVVTSFTSKKHKVSLSVYFLLTVAKIAVCSIAITRFLVSVIRPVQQITKA